MSHKERLRQMRMTILDGLRKQDLTFDECYQLVKDIGTEQEARTAIQRLTVKDHVLKRHDKFASMERIVAGMRDRDRIVPERRARPRQRPGYMNGQRV